MNAGPDQTSLQLAKSAGRGGQPMNALAILERSEKISLVGFVLDRFFEFLAECRGFIQAGYWSSDLRLERTPFRMFVRIGWPGGVLSTQS